MYMSEYDNDNSDVNSDVNSGVNSISDIYVMVRVLAIMTYLIGVAARLRTPILEEEVVAEVVDDALERAVLPRRRLERSALVKGLLTVHGGQHGESHDEEK